ncbi:MAG: DUF2975 domain-containing protein [Candidatus Izemoplasmatales bacterium]
MKTKFDKKNFDLILNVTRFLTKITLIFLIVIFTVLTLVSVGVIFINSANYNIDLENITHFTLSVASLDIDMPIKSMTGTLNVRYLILYASATGMIYVASFYYLFKKADAFLAFVKQATPFHPDNIHLMYHIGKVLVILSIALPLITLPFSWAIAHALPIDVQVNIGIQGGLLIIGLIVLLLASIFNYGAYLQEEYDQTV